MHTRRGPQQLSSLDTKILDLLAGSLVPQCTTPPKFQPDKQDTHTCYHNFHQDSALVALLKTCAKQKNLHSGSRIHAAIANRDTLKHNVFVGSTLINMYAKCGALAHAQEVFDELPVRNTVSWNALITGYLKNGCSEDALSSYKLMQRSGLFPDAVTFSCILKVCGNIGALQKGIEIHEELVGKRLLENNTLLSNAVIDMYINCGALAKAQKVFDDLPARDVVSWTTLIAGYCQLGHGEKALDFYERMRGEGLSPDAVTLRCILKACGSIGAAKKGKEVHAEIVREGYWGKKHALGNALVDMYAKCGALAAAQEVFDGLRVQDIVAWTALITGYAQNGHGGEALRLFEKMQGEGLSPNAVTFLCVLKACCSIGAAEKGESIHAGFVREGLMGRDNVFGNALVDMYAKCGALGRSQRTFNELPVRNVVSWTALIAGYAQGGKHNSVFGLFNKMIEEEIKPTLVTFLVLLNSCSYLGLVNEGQMYFETMSSKYGIVPSLQHHTCMVDLFGRAGHLDKAISVIRNMPSCKYLSVWFALLTACQKWGNVKLGSFAFKCALSLNGHPVSVDVYMHDIFGGASIA